MLNHYGRKRRVYYLIFAIAFAFVWYLFKLGGFPKPLRALFSTIIDITFSITALVVTVELLLPKFFLKKKYLQFTAGFLIVSLAAALLIITCQIGLMGYTVAGYYQKNLTQYREHFYYWFWSDLVLGSYFLVSFISLGGFAIRLSFDRIIAARQMETLEKERNIAELETLKNQINPHFLFNALNTIYYKIDRVNTPARLMVEQFSSLLRYQLYECDVPEVEIEKELKFIINYVELQKKRLSESIMVGYDGLDDIEGFLIAPFILMPVVENCFKHVSQIKDGENVIAISAAMKDGWFCFETINTVNGMVSTEKKGIGLSNVKKRLELIYPGNYSLTIDKANEKFKLTLTIKVK
ncbi:histidine kinase [Mucilaginibacter sp.]|uniref:sensor histidine kinase n=1 Tax=Mucilaginibacter sp. TaxID=1882438 RepID=UPI0025CBC9BC|nr:histidine kinase [Mucilaginibacter sp.]